MPPAHATNRCHTSTRASFRRGTADRTRCPDRSGRARCARCRCACSPRAGVARAPAAAPGGSAASRAHARRSRAGTSRTTPTTSSLNHSPATNDSPAPISPRSTSRRNNRSSCTRTRGPRSAAEPYELAGRQLETECIGVPARAQPCECGAAQQRARRRRQTRHRDHQWMSDVAVHPALRRYYERPRHAVRRDLARAADGRRAAGGTARPRAAA